MQTVRHAHTKTSARALLLTALLAALALPFSARPARAATITISDQASCEAAGGVWDSSRNKCSFRDYTVAAGDVLQTTVEVNFDSLTNDGTINFTYFANVSAFVNNGSINITNRRLRLRGTGENNGTINVNSSSTLQIFPDTAVLTNKGTIIINDGGELYNLGTVDNQNVIQLNCGGSITGNAIMGNPVQDNCPPSVTINQSVGQADPTTASPINFTAVFSESVTGFTSADVTLSGTAGATTAVVSEIAPNDGTTYTVAVSGMTGNGTVMASVPAGGVTDAAGNSNTASASTDNTVTYNLPDSTPPVITPTVVGTLGNNGWYTSNVTVSWSVVDDESAIASQSGCGSTTLTTDTAGTTLTCSATSAGGTASRSVIIKRDQTAPSVACSVSPTTLRPPNHKLRSITATVTVTDALAGPAGFTLVSVTSNEPDSGLNAEDVPNDIQGWSLNTPDTSGQLRAERSGAGSGRRYTLTYRGLDSAGNAATCSATVTVPRN